MYVIDTTKPEFQGLPETLNGHVLLERNPDGTVKATAPLKLVQSMKGKDDATLEALGWLRYKNISEAV